MISTSIVRQRGQLTVPEGVRGVVDWLDEGRALEWRVKNEEVVLKPQRKTQKVNWKKIWGGVNLCRSFIPTDNKQISMSEFVMLDRRMH